MQNKKGSKTILGAVAVILGCAACCALPLLAGLGMVGISGGLIAWLASHELMFGLGVAALVFVGSVLWKAARMRRAG